MNMFQVLVRFLYLSFDIIISYIDEFNLIRDMDSLLVFIVKVSYLLGLISLLNPIRVHNYEQITIPILTYSKYIFRVS